MINDKNKHISKHSKGGFQVQIWHNGKNHYLGYHSSLDDAILNRDIFLKKNSQSNKSKTNESHYIENKEMMYEVIVSKAQGQLSTNLLLLCMKIVKGVSKKFTYKDYEDRLDCEAFAYEVIIKNWYHFDELRYDNPFAYYTECIKRAFAMQFKILQKTRLNTISLDYTFDNGKSIQNYI